MTKPAEPSADERFAALAARFLEGYLAREPVRATEAGDHRYDARWPDPSAEGDAEARVFVKGILGELEAIPRESLGLQHRVDAGMLENRLRAFLFALDELREREWNPTLYTGLVGDGLDPLVTRDFAPIEERMKNLRARLEGVPAIVAVAKKRLANPPRIHTETAILQNEGLVALCEGGLAEHFAKVPGEKAALEAAAQKAAAALRDLQTFLEKDLLPRSQGDFRLGRARFEKKLRHELEADVDPDAIVAGARALLERTQADMAETAKELWPTLMRGKKMPAAKTPDERKAMVRAVLDAIAADRPTNATIVDESSRILADATAFVREKDLVRVPDEPCRVIEMPEYRRGVAVAYCDASGPLEKKQETFYAISPTPKDWPRKRVESFYREYNRSMLSELTVHEAMPGHFLQIMHGNRFRSDVRAVFSSGAFVEGWAVYAEWLMAKHGFGGPKVRMMRQKMVLRLAANAILDHGVHAGTMEEAEAMTLMTKEAFQEEGEAVGKWKRARLTSAQLTTYYFGFTEMMKLREEAEKSAGFSERAYHDKLLSFGAPSPKYLRELVLPLASGGAPPATAGAAP